jgi:hypothetical protein
MLGFDRGGAYAQVFRHCREAGVDWVTYRRGGLVATTAAPRRHWRVDAAGRAEAVTLADEMVRINDYGPARQLTLFEHDPNAKRAILHTQRRSLQMVLRLLAFNAEQWLASRLNAYLADNDEYRATLRHLLHLGGQITYTTKTITVALDTPTTPKITRALWLLLDELNTTPPRIPGDHRPITYKIKTA